MSIKNNQGSERLETKNIDDALPSLLGKYKQRGIKIQDIKVDRGTLEQHFMELARERMEQ